MVFTNMKVHRLLSKLDPNEGSTLVKQFILIQNDSYVPI